MEISKDKKKFEEIFLVILLAFPFVQIFELNNYRLFYNLFIFSGFAIAILILLILHRLELKYQGKFVNIKLYYIASLTSIFLDKYLGLFYLFRGNIGLELKFLEFKYFLNYFLSFVLLIILTIFIFRILKLMQNNKLILIYIISLFISFNLIINFFYNFQYQTLDNYSLSLQKKNKLYLTIVKKKNNYFIFR